MWSVGAVSLDSGAGRFLALRVSGEPDRLELFRRVFWGALLQVSIIAQTFESWFAMVGIDLVRPNFYPESCAAVHTARST